MNSNFGRRKTWQGLKGLLGPMYTPTFVTLATFTALVTCGLILQSLGIDVQEAIERIRKQPPSLGDFLLGLFMGALITVIIVTFWSLHESTRFITDLKRSGGDPNRRIRLPFSARAITHEEFKKMWGDDPMPK